jgi:hypothetical protein
MFKRKTQQTDNKPLMLIFVEIKASRYNSVLNNFITKIKVSEYPLIT